MTHTLHRRGTADSLERDIIFLIMPSKDINHVGSHTPLKRFFEIALEAGAVKIGDCRSGNEYFQGSLQNVINKVQDRAVIHAVFNDEQKAIDMLHRLKEAELGLSVVVSGLLPKVDGVCKHNGIQRHTVEHSLGVWGRVDKLPPEPVLEINTMCGHGMVTVALINDVLDRVRTGGLTPEKGAEELFKPCMCGIFNPKRAAELIRNLMAEEKTARVEKRPVARREKGDKLHRVW
jgi:hypothetical protein